MYAVTTLPPTCPQQPFIQSTMSSYHCPTCLLVFKSSPSLIHHFNKNFPTCRRAKDGISLRFIIGLAVGLDVGTDGLMDWLRNGLAD